MHINLKNGTGEIRGKCPKCDVDIYVSGLPRWDSNVGCPNCGEMLFIKYDFCEMEDDEEFDVYEIKSTITT